MVQKLLSELSSHGLDVFQESGTIRLRGEVTPQTERLLEELRSHKAELENLLYREAEAIAQTRCWRCKGAVTFERRAGLMLVVKCPACGSVAMLAVNVA